MKFLEPLSIIKKTKAYVFSWVACMLFFGQVGIILLIIFNGIKEGIILNLKLGNLYTFSIALLSVGLFNFAEEYITTKEIIFKAQKVCTLILTFILMFIIAIFVAISQNMSQPNNVIQGILYITSIFLSFYYLSLALLRYDYDNYKHLDDVSIYDLKQRTDKANEDDRGVKI